MYQLNIPTRVFAGNGSCKELGKILKEYGVKKAFCVYDQGIKTTGLADIVLGSVKAEGIDIVEYDKIQSDPPDTVVDEAGVLAYEANVDAIIGIGGGSTLDSAKSVNVIAGGNKPPVRQYIGENVPKKPGKLLFLIPTTAGTGADVTAISCITNTENGIKSPIISSICTVPTVSIVDPELTMNLPAKLTASTGFDTLAHAVESYTSCAENPITFLLGRESIRLAGQYLRRAVKNGPNDPEAREGMALSCLLAAISFSHTYTHLGHGLGTPFGGRRHIAHGTACGVFLPVAVEYVAPVLPERVRDIGGLLGIDVPANASAEQIGKVVADGIRKLRKDIDFPTLFDLGVKEEDLPQVAEDGVNEFVSKFCCRELNYDAVLKLVKEEYKVR